MTLSFGNVGVVPEAASALPTQWVAAWRDAVRSCPTPAGLLDLRSETLLALSPANAALLGVAPDHVGPLAFDRIAVLPEQAKAFMVLAREGYFDGLEGRRRFTSPDGSVVDMPSLGRVIAFGDTRDIGLWVLGDTDAVVSAGRRLDTHAGLRSLDVEAALLTLGVVGDRWRVIEADAAGENAGWAPPRGAALGQVTHPADISVLLLAMAAATTSAEATAHLRWHVGGEWRSAVAGVTMRNRDALPEFAITLRLPLARAPMPLDESALSALGELPVRQREVLVRLVRGERVRQIAREMYLSESTVRNHLVAIYRKADVHSQQELLSRLRVADDAAAPLDTGRLAK